LCRKRKKSNKTSRQQDKRKELLNSTKGGKGHPDKVPMIIEGEHMTNNDTNVSHLTDPNFQDLKYDEDDIQFYQLLVKRREKRKEEARQ